MPDWSLVFLLITLGFILFLIELFTPGFGLAGIGGLMLIILGSYVAYTKLNLVWGIICSMGSLLGIIGFFKVFVRTGVWKRMRLDTTEDKKNGFQIKTSSEGLLDKEGKTISPLRPGGTAIIEGKRVDVSTEGLYIDTNRNVQVIKIEGNKIIVREK